ncbi:MAG: sulfite exporter TauE/SafE family protein [Planctomycetota bacterium]
MLALLESFELTQADWAVVVVCALLVGFAKTGIAGVGILVVPLMAEVFGARPSTGIVLPMLCAGDLFAIRYYHRHAEWRHVLRLLPWALVGLGVGLLVGKRVDETVFRQIMAVSILAGVAIMVWRERLGDAARPPERWWFAAVMGIAGGFTTMVGNAAGPVMALYLLAMRLPKYSYIGTGAWYFAIVNLIKVPLHIFVWGTITTRTAALDLAIVPAIAVGAIVGIFTVKRIPEAPFRRLMIGLAAVAAVKLLI